MEAEEDPDKLLERIIYVLQSQHPSHCRNIGPIAFTRAPFFIRQRLAIQLLQKRLLHHSYLHSLALLAYGGLPGEVILDQLLQKDADLHFLEHYLTLVTPEQALQFLQFTTPLVHDDFHIIKSKVANCTPFPLDYLEIDDHLQSFTPTRIAKLVSLVCRAKNLEIPRAIKIILFEEFGSHLIQNFLEAHIYTNDFVVMVQSNSSSTSSQSHLLFISGRC